MTSHMCRQWIIAYLIFIPVWVVAYGDPQLVKLAKSGNQQAIQLLLEKQVDVNAAETDGTTALHWAAYHDDLKIAEMLIQAGAYVSPANEYGVTPLYLACTNRSDTMVEMLLESGADPAAVLWTGETVLMNCARTGTVKALSALLAAGAEVNARESRQGQDALMWAAAMGHSKVVQILLDHGADVGSTTIATADKLPITCRVCDWKPSIGGFTPLLFAARSGDVESARLLMDAGADPDEATNEVGNTLVLASASGHEELALFLLQMGANSGSADEHGVTALHHAFSQALSRMHGMTYDPVYRKRPVNMPRLAKALLQAGANPNMQISRSYNIGPAIRDKCENISGMEGATPFMLAAISSELSLMRLLREFGADPHLTARDGTTSLMAAIQAACNSSSQRGDKNNNEEVNLSLQAVKVIIEEMGVDVNAVNDEGVTAMHMAAFVGANPVVQYLADHNALVDIKSNSGETPWSMAAGISPSLNNIGSYGIHKTTAELLLALGASIISRDQMQLSDPYINITD